MIAVPWIDAAKALGHQATSRESRRSRCFSFYYFIVSFHTLLVYDVALLAFNVANVSGAIDV